jgi:hypothetical protein
MGKHIDCMNLIIINGDDVNSYFCLILREYISIEKIDEAHECSHFKPLWKQEKT